MVGIAQLVALGLGLMGLTQAAPQGQPTPQAQASPTTDVGDVDVVGTRRQQMERLSTRFVDEVAAPAAGRGLARWMAPVCVGVVNFRPETGRAIADRISTTAGELGIAIRDDDCAPNVFIVGAADGPAMARRWVAERRNDFAFNVNGVRPSNAALADFQRSEAPVRWWQVSMPMHLNRLTDTAGPAMRFPGRPPPELEVPGMSTIRARRRDDLFRVVVIVDVSRLGEVSLDQLSDYLVMVSFAQFDPRADTTPYDTVLNLFDRPGSTSGLSDWDRAYMTSLYGADADERLNDATQAAALLEKVVAIPPDTAP